MQITRQRIKGSGPSADYWSFRDFSCNANHISAPREAGPGPKGRERNAAGKGERKALGTDRIVTAKLGRKSGHLKIWLYFPVMKSFGFGLCGQCVVRPYHAQSERLKRYRLTCLLQTGSQII